MLRSYIKAYIALHRQRLMSLFRRVWNSKRKATKAKTIVLEGHKETERELSA